MVATLFSTNSHFAYFDDLCHSVSLSVFLILSLSLFPRGVVCLFYIFGWKRPQRKPSRAAATLEECLVKAPQSKELKLIKVDCLMAMGKHEEAYAISSALIRHSQNNSKLLITRARCLYLMGNLDSAVKHLQVKMKPHRVGAAVRRSRDGGGGEGGQLSLWRFGYISHRLHTNALFRSAKEIMPRRLITWVAFIHHAWRFVASVFCGVHG